MALPVLAATLTRSIVFFPVMFLYGVSRFLFSALALAVVLSLFASYFVAMTVVPLFCARFIKACDQAHEDETGHGRTRTFVGSGSTSGSTARFERLLSGYDRTVDRALDRPVARTLSGSRSSSSPSLTLYPLLGVAFFPRTDAGQFVINLKAPSGTRLEVTADEVAKVEDTHPHEIVAPDDLGMIVSNIGVTPGFLGDLHQQLGAAHRIRPGRPEGGPPHRQLRVHGPRADRDLRRSCRTDAPTSSRAAWSTRCSTWACRRRSTCR